MSMLNVQIYIKKNKTFIIRSYISVSSKPSKTHSSSPIIECNLDMTL